MPSRLILAGLTESNALRPNWRPCAIIGERAAHLIRHEYGIKTRRSIWTGLESHQKPNGG
jgi:hypothetical protein